jgi:hypothetical protein
MRLSGSLETPSADHGPIMELLTAYMRQRAGATTSGPVPPAVHAALAVLKRRIPRSDELDLDLRSTQLAYAKLPGASANLEGVDLRCVDLPKDEADRRRIDDPEIEASVQRTLLRAQLQGTNLCDVRGTDEADLTGAECDGDTIWTRGRLRASYARTAGAPADSRSCGPHHSGSCDSSSS